MAELAVVGKRVARVDAAPKVLGQAQFVEDISLPNMLHGKILRSPLPHARILHIDTSRARALPGVKAIITGDDIPKVKYGCVPMAADEYALAVGKVRHVGEAVAAVAAVDEETALEALELIRVEYEPLPAVFDPLQAMQPGAPVIHEEVPDNVSAKLVKAFGDVQAGFREADHIREDTFRTAPNNHAPLEPHGAVSLWHPNGTVTTWTTTQIPFFLRRNLAKTLGLSEDKVRVIKTAVGGGFGGKIDLFAHNFASAYLSKLTGRPVKIILSREEVFLSTRQRHPMILTVRTGAKRDGTLTAQEMKLIADGGAYNSTAPLLITISAYFLMIPYILHNLHYEGYHVYTNKPVGGPMRGHGVPQVRFAIESHLDMLAEDLGIDPVDLRLKNALYAGYPHPGPFTIHSCGLREAIEEVATKLNWREKRGKLPRGRGIGIACAAFPSGEKHTRHVGSGAIVEINIDGAVNLLTGAIDIGQGSDTVLSQMAAEELGVRLEDVRITTADTATTPLDSGTYGSGVTFRAGNAVRAAARDAKRQLLEVVAPRLEADPEEIEFREGRVYVRGDPSRGMSFQEAVRLYRYADKPMPIVGRGFYMPDGVDLISVHREEGKIAEAYSFMAQGVEVEVDPETGQVKVLQVVTAHDCGRMINPTLVEGQLEGSVVGGMGMALHEDLPHTEGRYLNPSFLDYSLPTALDTPEEIQSIPIETHDPLGPFGAKEAGEGIQLAMAPAIANAIYDAVGVRIQELPITPDKVLRGLEGRGPSKAPPP